MSKLAVIGTAEAAPENRDQVASLLMAHGARCLKDEPGTLQFAVMIPQDDDAKVRLYEVYEDDTAFELHRNGASRARWLEESAGLGVKITFTRCTFLEK